MIADPVWADDIQMITVICNIRNAENRVRWASQIKFISMFFR